MKELFSFFSFVTNVFFLFFISSCTPDTSCPNFSQTHINDDVSIDSETIFYLENAGIYIKRSAQTTNAKTKSFSGETKKYYATTFFPKNVSEQLFLSNLKEISVSYIPWDYDPVKEDLTFESPKNTIEYFKPEKANPHCFESVIKGDTTLIFLPVMYALWPENIDFPNIEHEIVEKIESPLIDPEPSRRYTLTLRAYDSLLGGFVPLKNIKVHFKLGMFSEYITSNAQGTVQITPTNYVNAPLNDSDISVYITFETNNFNIVRDNDSGMPFSTISITKTLGTLGSIFGTYDGSNPPPQTITLFSSTTEIEDFRAADHYFTDSHYLSYNRSTSESGVTIIAHDNPLLENGGFCYGETDVDEKIIAIYNTPALPMQETISTLLHELGHIRHYEKNHTTYNSSSLFIQESYASFVGWLLCEQYYLSKGYIKPYTNFQITEDWRQHWYKNIPSSLYNYSPIFIDLWDNYNQNIGIPTQIYDNIAYVPISVIEGMASCTSLQECLVYMENLVGIYYTQYDFNTMSSFYL